MRHLLTLGTAFGMAVLAAGCTTGPATPPKVSWAYGSGAGDGVQYQGPKATYTRSYGMGAGDGVSSGVKINPTYSYGAEGQTGNMIQLAPTPPTQVAAPTPVPATSSHL